MFIDFLKVFHRRRDLLSRFLCSFSEIVKESAEDAVETIKKLSSLHDKNVAAIDNMGRQAKTARKIYDYIEQNPIIDIGKTATELEISFNTASSYINRLVDLGILIQTTNAERKRVYAYEDYLTILRKDT